MPIRVCARKLLSYNLLDAGRQSQSQMNCSWQNPKAAAEKESCVRFLFMCVKVLFMTNHVSGNKME